MSTKTRNAIARKTTTKETTTVNAAQNNRAKRRAAAKSKPAPAAKVQKSKTLTFAFLKPTDHKLRFVEQGETPLVGSLYVRKSAAALFGFTADGKLSKGGEQKTMTLRFAEDRTTKGTIVFAEGGHQDAIGSIYMRKDQALAILGIKPDSKTTLKVTLSPTKVGKSAGVKLTIEVC